MVARLSNTTQIAGRLTRDDWNTVKGALTIGGDEDAWAKAFQDFFWQRVNLCYLEPIKVLHANGTWEGEGFSIVSIQCALIEFLAAARQGKKYRYLRAGQTLGPHEYNRSGELYREFLSTVQPFSASFDAAAAADFYQSVRCALLHEARTHNGWRLWVSGAAPIDAARKIVYREALQNAISAYVEAYGRDLTTDHALQEAFIRKFDDLAA